MNKYFILVALCLLGLYSAPAQADASCSATNGNGDATCSISCGAGQAAVCQNATGSNTPTCYCAPGNSAALRQLKSKAPQMSTTERVAAAQCIVMTADVPGKIKLANTCNKCEVALMSWSGIPGLKSYQVGPYSAITIPVESSYGQLVGDHPC